MKTNQLAPANPHAMHQALNRQGRRIQPPQPYPYDRSNRTQQHQLTSSTRQNNPANTTNKSAHTDTRIQRSHRSVSMHHQGTNPSNTPHKPTNRRPRIPSLPIHSVIHPAPKNASRQLAPTRPHCGGNRLGRGTVGRRAVGERGFYASASGLSNGKCTVSTVLAIGPAPNRTSINQSPRSLDLTRWSVPVDASWIFAVLLPCRWRIAKASIQIDVEVDHGQAFGVASASMTVAPGSPAGVVGTLSASGGIRPPPRTPYEGGATAGTLVLSCGAV